MESDEVDCRLRDSLGDGEEGSGAVVSVEGSSPVEAFPEEADRALDGFGEAGSGAGDPYSPFVNPFGSFTGVDSRLFSLNFANNGSTPPAVAVLTPREVFPE